MSRTLLRLGACTAAGLSLWVCFEGCSAFRKTRTANLYRAEGFSPAEVGRRGLVICAAVSSDPARLELESSPEDLAQLFERQLREKQPELFIVSADELARDLPATSYTAILEQLEVHAQLTSDQIAAIANGLKAQAGFAVCSRIREDVVRLDSEPQYSQSGDSRIQTGTTYYTHRKSVFEFQVYDLSTGAVAWRTDISRPSSEAEFAPGGASPSLADALAGTVLDALLGTSPGPYYPEPTGIEVQARHVFGRFADEFFDG